MTLTRKEINIINMANESPFMKLSVITNFGCEFNCYYCIWKQLNYGIKDKIGGLAKLYSIMKIYKKDAISISGGGDPLFEFNRNEKYLTKVLDIAEKFGVKVSIHTRYIPDSIHKKVIDRINKLVISFDDIDKIDKDRIDKSGVSEIRLVYIVKYNDTVDKVGRIVDKVVKYGYQLTLKNMIIIGRKRDDKYIKLLMDIKSKYGEIDGVMLLPTADYNIYYFPDSSIRDRFISKK